jgi:hypothetical protein
MTLLSLITLQQLSPLLLFSPSLDCGKKLQNEDFLIWWVLIVEIVVFIKFT